MQSTAPMLKISKLDQLAGQADSFSGGLPWSNPNQGKTMPAKPGSMHAVMPNNLANFHAATGNAIPPPNMPFINENWVSLASIAGAEEIDETLPEEIVKFMTAQKSNPISIFYQLYSKLKKEPPIFGEQWTTGEDKMCRFMLSIELSGQMFYGRLCSQKKASKLSCVNRALPTLFNMYKTQIDNPELMDATGGMDLVEAEEDDMISEALPDKVKEAVARSGKNPIMLFTEIYTKVYKKVPDFEYRKTAGKKNKLINMYVCTLNMGEKTIEGKKRSSKKAAKTSVSLVGLPMLCESYGEEAITKSIEIIEPKTFGERLKKETYNLFLRLGTTNPLVYATENVISAFFLEDKQSGELKTLALATGTKCIYGESLSLTGDSVTDCHAEILTRRGLLRVFYYEIKKFTKGEPSIFFVTKSGKLDLRPELALHLFISSPPCGSARISFRAPKAAAPQPNSGDVTNTSESAKEQSTSGGGIPSTPPSNSTDIKLRYKVDRGMGTILGDPEKHYQTFDGVLGGERLLTMSCTDKLTKWQLLGLQGALLSHLLEPIYLSSLVIGSRANVEHMKRVLFERIAGFDALPAPFRKNLANISAVECSSDSLKPNKYSALSMNWNAADESVELIKTCNGMVPNENSAGDAGVYEVSRLAKSKLVQLFKESAKELKRPVDVAAGSDYMAFKQLSEPYCTTRDNLKRWVYKNQLGIWHSKPEDCKKFIVH